MKQKRFLQLFALLMIGDGVTGLIKPRRHSLLWDVGPKPVRHLMEELIAHPEAARAVYAAEILLGTWLATQQTPEHESLF